MKVNVIGLGYIGLPTAIMLAAHGTEVVGTDINTSLVEQLNNHIIHFNESGMMELFDQAIEHQILFSNEYQKADIYIIAVPTPYLRRDKK